MLKPPASWSFVQDDDHAPPPGSEGRSNYLRWLFFAVTELAPTVLEAMIAAERRDEAALATARQTFETHACVLERALAHASHLLGEVQTAADVKVGAIIAWAQSLDLGLVETHPLLADYARRVLDRDG
jgi:glutathione S-transferase